MHKLFVISGPSGVGKTTVSNLVMDRANALAEAAKSPGVGLNRVITTTTRDPRPGEVDGVDYHFRTVKEFRRLIDEDKLVEYAEVYGNFYGSTYDAVNLATDDRNAIIVTDVQGAAAFSEMDRVETIFLRPVSIDDLRLRMDNRSSVDVRLVTAVEECKLADHFSHVVVNDSLGQTVLEVERIISGR